jgi:uncharacterized membrane protein
MLFEAVKWVHIIGATVLFGTGLGIAFFMFASRFSDDLAVKLFLSRTTVIADYLFTLPAVIVQPASGIALIVISGYDWREPWLLASYALYILAGICWLPVVFIQIRLRDIAGKAAAEGGELPETYHRLFRIWFWLGWPAFIALLMVFYLMIAKPG